MDSNSNSSEIYWPKIKEEEPDNETRKEFTCKMTWTSENIMKLIEALEKDCKELWDWKHPQIKDRAARHAKHEYLANMFGTTVEEISRKIHNLRTQLNNERRKIKRRQATSIGGEGSLQGGSGWEYFEALSFLQPLPASDPLDHVEGVNLATNEERLLEKRLAERKRYASIKSDPHKYQLLQIKEKQRYQKEIAEKKRLKIADMTPVQKREQRKKWRKYNRNRQSARRMRDSDSTLDEIPSNCEIIIPESSGNSLTSLIMKIEDDSVTEPFETDGKESLLAEFQAEEEVEFGAAARALSNADSTSTPVPKIGKQSRVPASIPPPLPPSAHPLMWPEDPVPGIRPGINPDECQIFGDFVASELRALRSDESRKRLKRMIQKAILQIGEEEDMNTICG